MAAVDLHNSSVKSDGMLLAHIDRPPENPSTNMGVDVPVNPSSFAQVQAVIKRSNTQKEAKQTNETTQSTDSITAWDYVTGLGDFESAV
jgi:hypothetical protein